MEAHKCDRCGCYYDMHNNSKKALGVTVVTCEYDLEFDLCDNCLESLYDFLNLKWEESENK